MLSWVFTGITTGTWIRLTVSKEGKDWLRVFFLKLFQVEEDDITVLHFVVYGMMCRIICDDMFVGKITGQQGPLNLLISQSEHE